MINSIFFVIGCCLLFYGILRLLGCVARGLLVPPHVIRAEFSSLAFFILGLLLMLRPWG